MANFVPLLFVDHFDLTASLPRQIGLFDHGMPRILPVWIPRKGTEEADEDMVWHPGAAKWVQLKSFLTRLKREAERLTGPIDLGRCYLEMLDPGMTLPWTTESGPYIERFTRTHLALRTNPAALMVSGSEAASLGPGWLTAVNPQVPCTAINLGQHPRVHLVVDFRKKDVADGQDR